MKTKPVEIRKLPLPNCRKCSNREERSKNSISGICNLNTSTQDELPLRCVGRWANDKIHYLVRYFDIFAKGMSKKWANKLRYVEICSGTGRCSTRDGYEQDGTALAVLNHPSFSYITDAVFIDNNPVAVDALNKRIAAIGAENRACAVVSDYRDTESLRRALTRQRFKGLTFCLIDPTSCDIPFDSIRAIKKYSGYKCDMLITFFDLVDFIRNAVNSVNNPAFAQTQSRYAEFLGANDFFKRQDVVEAADYNNTKFLLEAFRDTYRTQLKSLDYFLF